MAGDEDETQHVVVDAVGVGIVGHRVDRLGHESLRDEQGLALRHPLAPSPPVDRAPLGDRHEPGSRIVRDAAARPRGEGFDERLLSEILGPCEVAGVPSQRRDDARGLVAPHGFDRTARVGIVVGGHAASVGA